MNAYPIRVAATVTVAALSVSASTAVLAQGVAADSSIKVTFGAFVDAAYAYDRNTPTSRDRAFTTQPARHNEFNVNLAFVEANVSGPRVRGRLALQAGTSVQSNYAAEPRQGSVSGPELSRLLQEAYAGYQVTPSLWVDGGVFFSNMGMEGWVSRDNPVYTRSLVADFSPYYSTGVRATWQATSKLTARLDVVNGWQNISESNDDKSAGVRLDYAATANTGLSYYGYAGNEPGARLRLFNGVGIKSRLADKLDVMAQLDAGAQDRADSTLNSSSGRSTWYGGMLIGRLWVTPRWAVTGRVERYADTDQVIIVTGSADPFRANSVSLGVDVRPEARVLWRSEVRAYQADRAVFPDRRTASGVGKGNAVVVTSLALTF